VPGIASRQDAIAISTHRRAGAKSEAAFRTYSRAAFGRRPNTKDDRDEERSARDDDELMAELE
jgi:hypothetical protein